MPLPSPSRAARALKRRIADVGSPLSWSPLAYLKNKVLGSVGGEGPLSEGARLAAIAEISAEAIAEIAAQEDADSAIALAMARVLRLAEGGPEVEAQHPKDKWAKKLFIESSDSDDEDEKREEEEEPPEEEKGADEGEAPAATGIFAVPGGGWALPKPKLHPVVAALQRQCTHGRCGLKSMDQFIPLKPKAEKKFRDAEKRYVSASSKRGKKRAKRDRNDALAEALADLEEAAVKTCVRCRDVTWVSHNNPALETNIAKDLLKAWQARHLTGTSCVGGHCGSMAFTKDNLGCVQLDHGGNAHLKKFKYKKKADGTWTEIRISGPTDVQSLKTTAAMFTDAERCTPMCGFCHAKRTYDEQQAAVKDARAALHHAPRGETKKERKARKMALSHLNHRLDKQAYVNKKKHKIGCCQSPGCTRRVVAGYEPCFHFAHRPGKEHLKYRDKYGSGVARLSNLCSSLWWCKRRLDAEMNQKTTALLCANCHKLDDTNKTNERIWEERRLRAERSGLISA